MKWQVVAPILMVTMAAGGVAVFRGSKNAGADPMPVAARSATGARTEARAANVVAGEAQRKTRGDLALYSPAELAVGGDGAFDLVVHFHGTTKNQENNLDEAKLPAAVVSVNEGVTAESYAKGFSAPGALDRIVSFAESEVRAKRPEATHVGRIALSAWSAGGLAVKGLLVREPDRFDAVMIADGLFSSWEDPAKKTVRLEGLAPFTDYARRAMRNETLLVLTHTQIPTVDYPNVEACTGALLGQLELEKSQPFPLTQPSGGQPTYAVDRGSFHVRGVDGKGKDDHIAQIRALDDAYAELRRRWGR